MKNILIVDDNSRIWEKLFINIFNKKDYNVDFCEDCKTVYEGDTNVQIENYSKYDVLIVDYFLKNNLTGVDWVKENVKSRDPYLPVVFWTSSMDVHVIQETLIGEHVFFKKHLDLKSFKKVIDKSINKRRQYKQYPLYNVFFNTKITNIKNRKLCHKVYVNTSKYLESFFSHSKYHSVFNAHGLIHTQNVLNNLSKLMYPIADEFSQEEYLVAYISTILHDFGMMPVKYNDDIELSEFHKIRSNHCKTIYWWIVTGQIEELLDFEFYSEFQRYAIGTIDLFHDGHYSFEEFLDSNAFDDILKKVENIYDIESKALEFKYNKKNHNSQTTKIDNKNLCNAVKSELKSSKIKDKIKILSSLVALADKLDYGSSRVPISVVRKSPYRGLKDEFEYLINGCFLSYDFRQGDNKTVIEIETIKPNYKPKINKDESIYKTCFNAFKDEIVPPQKSKNKNEYGVITSKAYDIAAYMLHNIINKKWINIKGGFENCKIKFLENLDIIWKPSKTKTRDNYSIFDSDTFNFENMETISTELSDYEDELIKYVFKDNYGKTIQFKILVTGYSSEKVIMFPNLSKQVSFNNDKFYKLNNVILKIGNFERIHNEVQNYKNYAVPYIHPRSLIGYIEEFKYLDKAAFKSLITPDEAMTLDDAIDYDNVRQIFNKIINSLNVFYDKIAPFIDNNTHKKLIDDLNRKINKYTKPNSKIGLTKQQLIILEKIRIRICSILDDPDVTITSSISHGDFTFRNLLSLGDDLIFIDFAETGINHFFLDAAKLEHFIIFERLISKTTDKINKERIINYYLGQIDINDEKLETMQKNISKIQFTIFKFFIEKINKAKIETNSSFEMNIARLFVNIWSLKFNKDFHLTIEKRIDIIQRIMKKLIIAYKKRNNNET